MHSGKCSNPSTSLKVFGGGCKRRRKNSCHCWSEDFFSMTNFRSIFRLLYSLQIYSFHILFLLKNKKKQKHASALIRQFFFLGTPSLLQLPVNPVIGSDVPEGNNRCNDVTEKGPCSKATQPRCKACMCQTN